VKSQYRNVLAFLFLGDGWIFEVGGDIVAGYLLNFKVGD
jgi:hypothetical protein